MRAISGETTQKEKAMWTERTLGLAALLMALTLALPGRARSEDAPDPESSNQLFQRGEYARAAELFEQELERGGAPSAFYNLARTYEELRRFGDAIRAYDRYLALEDLPPARRHQAEVRRAALASLPGQLEVVGQPPRARVLLDGEPCDPPRITPTTLALPPGEHTLALELEGYHSLERTIIIDPGGEARLELTLEPEPIGPVEEEPEVVGVGSDPVLDDEPSRSPWPLTVFGTGLAVAATGSLLYALAYTQGEGVQPFADMDTYDDWFHRVGGMALAGDILVGVGAATLVAGLIWLLVDRHQRRERRDALAIRE
jgi:tetratricopeptide (TPR) repeat protein